MNKPAKKTFYRQPMAMPFLPRDRAVNQQGTPSTSTDQRESSATEPSADDEPASDLLEEDGGRAFANIFSLHRRQPHDGKTRD